MTNQYTKTVGDKVTIAFVTGMLTIFWLIGVYGYCTNEPNSIEYFVAMAMLTILAFLAYGAEYG